LFYCLEREHDRRSLTRANLEQRREKVMRPEKPMTVTIDDIGWSPNP